MNKSEFQGEKVSIPPTDAIARNDHTLRSDLRFQSYTLKRIYTVLERLELIPEGTNDAFPYNQALKQLSVCRFVRREHIDSIFSILEARRIKLSIHTFVLAMSAFLRSGDATSALVYFGKLIEHHKSNKIKALNTIAFTAAIRSASLLHDSERIFELYTDMRRKRYKCAPNIRTFQTLMRFFAQFTFERRFSGIVREATQSESPHVIEYCALLFARCGELEKLRALLTGTKSAHLTHTALLISQVAFSLHVDENSLEFCKSKQKDIKELVKTADETDEDDTQFYDLLVSEWKTLAAHSAQYLESGERLSITPMPKAPHCLLSGVKNTQQWKNIRQKEMQLEIGGGTGDWVIAQMQHSEAAETHWVSLDIRTDRLWQHWAKMAFHELPASKATFIGGDARASLRVCPDNYFANIYVNFPEPPTFYEDPDRLYNAEMLRTLHRILKEGGAFYFLTDDARLAVDIVREIQMKDVGFVVEGRGGLPWSTKAPKSYASSFFDAFWKKGSQNSRYFLTLVKKRSESEYA